MEKQTKEAWIILYTYRSTDDWIGGFPDTLYEWFVCDLAISKIPRIFDSEKEASQYINDNGLISAKAIQVAGEAALVTKSVSLPSKQNTDPRFSSRDELKTFIQMHIPLVVKPTKPAKTMFVSPFRSLNAKDIVIDTLTDALYNKEYKAILSQLDKMIEQAEENEKIFEEHNMVSSELTSGAMAKAYENVKNWILNED